LNYSFLRRFLCKDCSEDISVFEIENLFRRKLSFFASFVGIFVQSIELIYNYFLGQYKIFFINLLVLIIVSFVLLFFKKLSTKIITNLLVISLSIKILPIILFFKETLFPWIVLFPLISIILVGLRLSFFYSLAVFSIIMFVLIAKRSHLTTYDFQFYFEIILAYLTSFLIGSIYEFFNKFFHTQLKKQALKDFLTGLFNRRYFEEILRWEIELSKRYKHPLSIILVDLDDFKCINDKYGHQFGDKVLKMVAESIKRNIRSSDIPARYGGEEFIILLPETDLEGAKKVAEKLRRIIQELSIDNTKLTASFGITELLENDSMETFIKRADKALYRAKKEGKNKVIAELSNETFEKNCKNKKTD